MLVNNLGEFGLIERIRKSIKTDASVIKGIGDDCAVLEFSKDKYLLATCDMIVEGVDFTKDDDPYLVGRKALAVSISDIAACAGIPRQALISLGVPANKELTQVDKILAGIRNLAAEYKINIIGGDLSRAERIVLNTTVLGEVEKKFLVLRSRAKPGDIIFVSGALGGSILGKHLKFIPRVKEARYLVENFMVNAMIDISDGLAQDLKHILTESKVGAVIYEAHIPLADQASNSKDALYMGEDFELLFTMPAKEAKRLLALRRSDFKSIGVVVEKRQGLTLVDKKGQVKAIAKEGFRHF